MSCECITKLNEALRGTGEYPEASLDTAMLLKDGQLRVVPFLQATYTTATKTGKVRNKQLPITPTHCPFCGERYEPEAIYE